MREREQIKNARLSAGLTQKDLANSIGVTKSCISNIECGYATPSPQIICKIEDFLNVKFNVPIHKKMMAFASKEPSDSEAIEFCKTIASHGG